jgi:hypothetical protein
VLCTPLLRKDCAQDCWEFFLRWLAHNREGCSLLELPYVPGDGPFSQLLIQTGNRLGIVSQPVESTVRALFTPRASAEAYFKAALSSKRRQEFRRLERRLSELGRVQFRILTPAEDRTRWIEAFLNLEARGWKGNEGTALAQEAPNRSFFHAFMSNGFARRKLLMLGAFLDEKPIALKCNVIAGEASYALKIAYDEQYARYSPGVLLELFNIRCLHEIPDIRWMDSCAIPDHPMIDHLWLDRRAIQTVLISPGTSLADLLVSLVPFMRWLKRKLKPKRVVHNPIRHFKSE